MRATAFIMYVAATLASTEATFTTRSAPGAEPKGMVITWTKHGRLFRARQVTVVPQVATLTEVTSIVPTKTFALRPVDLTIRNTKRAFLNRWSFQGCATDDDKIPPLVSPFPYQLATEDTSGASCIHFCDQRGNYLAANQNGNEY